MPAPADNPQLKPEAVAEPKVEATAEPPPEVNSVPKAEVKAESLPVFSRPLSPYPCVSPIPISSSNSL